MADKRIYDLTTIKTVEDIDENTWVWMDKQAPEGEPALPSWKVRGDVLRQILDNFATHFVPNVQTEAGKCYWYNGLLYRCTTAYSGNWVPGNFTLTSVDELFARKDVLSALQSAMEDVQSDIEGLQDDATLLERQLTLVESSAMSKPLSPTETGKYVSNSLVVTNGSAFRYLSLPMKAGEKVIITTTNGGSSSVTAIMYAVDGVVTFSGSNRYYENYEFTASADGILYVNGTMDYTFSVVIVGQPQKNSAAISKAGTDIDSIFGTIPFDEGCFYNVSSSTSTMPTSRSSNASWESVKIAVKAGEKYKVKATGSSSALALSAYDSTGAAVYKSGTSLSDSTYTVTNDGYILVNSTASSNHYIERVSKYDSLLLDRKRELVMWVLSEQFTLVGSASYSDGIIVSPVAIMLPDKVQATLTITRNSEGLVTAFTVNDGSVSATLTLTRNSDGCVTAESLT